MIKYYVTYCNKHVFDGIKSTIVQSHRLIEDEEGIDYLCNLVKIKEPVVPTLINWKQIN